MGPAARWIHLALFLAAFEVLPALSILSLQPPAPRPAGAPLWEFSAERAMAHVRAIARMPRPAGSPANREARAYILGELRRLGLEVEVHRAAGPAPIHGPLESIVALIPGAAPGKHLLLACHHDSVARGPGAGDDAAGVAVLLETARALLAEGRPRRGVVLLFTDGEELEDPSDRTSGLRGAKALRAEGHPVLRESGLVLNFEARGNRGPSILFETSDQNGRLIEEFARAVERPVASSLSRSVYRLLPNDTDFTVFRQAGIPGLNFAFIDGVAAYHSELDTPENLSPASLQHHGDQALALARRFLEIDLEALMGADAVYFVLPGGLLVRYPENWAAPIAIALAALIAAILVPALRAGSLTPRVVHGAVWESLRAAVGPAALLGLAGWALFWVFEVIGLPLRPLPKGESLRSAIETLAVWNLALPLAVLRERLRTRRLPPGAAACGGALLWLILLLASSLVLPGGSYLFAWPFLASLPLLALRLRHARRGEARPSALEELARLLGALPGFIIIPPTAYLLSIAFAQVGALALAVELAWPLLLWELLGTPLSPARKDRAWC